MNNPLIKIFFIISFFSLYNLNPNSQEKNHFGFRSGIVMSNQSWISQGDPYGDYKIGFTGGLYYTRDISNNFSLQEELNYLQEGSYLPWSQKQEEFILNYFSFVMLAKIKFVLKKFTPYFCIGPRFDLLEYNKFYGYDFIRSLPPEKIDYGFSTSVGLGTNIFKKLQIDIECRFNLGFNKIFAMSGVVSSFYVQNHSFELVLCFGKNF